MMLRSYEATIDEGQLHWIGAEPPLKRARVIVTVLEDSSEPDRAFQHEAAVPKLGDIKQFFAAHHTDLSAFKFDRASLYDR